MISFVSLHMSLAAFQIAACLRVRAISTDTSLRIRVWAPSGESSSRWVVVTRCFTRCGGVHFFRQRQLFAWPRSSLCLREAELGETSFAQFHSKSDKSRLRRAICLILFFSVFLWLSWAGLDRDISGGGADPIAYAVLGSLLDEGPQAYRYSGQRSKNDKELLQMTKCNGSYRENTMEISKIATKRLKKANVLKNEKNKGETFGDQIEVVGDNIETYSVIFFKIKENVQKGARKWKEHAAKWKCCKMKVFKRC